MRGASGVGAKVGGCNQWGPGSVGRVIRASPSPGNRFRTELAGQKAPNVIFGGRLGQYKYYNMDQVIKAALITVAEEFDK